MEGRFWIFEENSCWLWLIISQQRGCNSFRNLFKENCKLKWLHRQETLVAMHCGLSGTETSTFSNKSTSVYCMSWTTLHLMCLTCRQGYSCFFKVTSQQFRASSLLLLALCRSHSNPAELTDEAQESDTHIVGETHTHTHMQGHVHTLTHMHA